MIQRRSCKALAAAVLVGGFSCSLLLARPGKVVTKGGQSFEGDVKESREQGVVEVTTANGENIRILAGNVNRVEYDENAPADGNAPPPADAPAPEPGSVEADLRNRLASLPRNDVPHRVQIARAALERREYGVARDALDQALQIDPRNQEARDLLTTVEAQRRLDQRGPAPAGNPKPAAAPAAGPPAGGLIPPLNPDDINRIRQREWTRDDKGIKIRVVGDVKRRFVATSRDNIRPADFNNLNVIEQGWQIVSKGDEGMRNDVRLTTDPLALREYRTIVQRAVLPTCATAACHGGGPTGNFQLYPRAEHEGEAYANFLTLSTYTYSPKGAGAPAPAPGAPAPGAPAAPGSPAPAPGAAPAAGTPAPGAAAGAPQARKYQMIDRDRPADSLLLQFALPPKLADTPHPDVQGFKPIFRTLREPKYDQFLRWISNDLSPLQKDYGIKIEKGVGATTQPQAQPAPAAPGEGGAAPADPGAAPAPYPRPPQGQAPAAPPAGRPALPPQPPAAR